MNEVIALFVFVEFVIGLCVTTWFVTKKVVFPAIDFIVEYLKSYDEFKKWRKSHG